MAKEKSQWLRDNPERNIYWLVLDNVQQFVRQRDHYIGTVNEMMTGTSAMPVIMKDCPKDAFDTQPYIENLEKQERKDLSIDEILEKIDLLYLQLVLELHFLDIVVQHVLSLVLHSCAFGVVAPHSNKK